MNTIVLKPSTNQKSLPQYKQILDRRIAEGFAANPTRVRSMRYIIVLDNKNPLFIATITETHEAPPLRDGGKRRSNISFRNPSIPENLIQILTRKSGENQIY
jgi:hypothetical protein